MKYLNLLFTGIFILAVSQNCHAKLLSAEGYGKTNQQAKDDALSSLASSIFVQIESSSESFQSDKAGNYFNSSTHSSTDLPLIGVKYDCYNAVKQQFCTVEMETTEALPHYHQSLQDLQNQINAQLNELTQLPVKQHYAYLSELLALYEQYEKYLAVMTYMTGKAKEEYPPKLSKRAVKNKLLKLEKKVNSIALGATLLTREIAQKNIYLRPATLENSREITPFASALLTQIRKRVNTVNQVVHADYFMNGSYQIHKQGLQVTYTVSDKKGRSIKTLVVEFSPSSYQDYRVKPNALDFDQLLHKGYAVSGDFKIQLSTNKGQRNLLFKNGETIELLVKLNRAGYFFVVGHTKNKQQELSYLLDLNDASGERKFVNYINADDANKWVSLGEFDASAPFGVESIQVIASQNDLVNRLPKHTFDPESEYYIASKNIKQGVKLTRGLKRKQKSKHQKMKMVESVLMFTTQK